MPFRRIPGIVGSLSLLVLSGCLYKFSGGGFPPDIKTVAVLPFDNLTAEPALTQEVTQAVRDAVQGRLGLKAAGEQTADAVVRGSISRYDPDQPAVYNGTQNNQVTVTRRMVQITLSIEIVNQKDGKTLWQRGGLMVDGEYEPGRELDGRKKAEDKLVTNIVDGAQSQW